MWSQGSYNLAYSSSTASVNDVNGPARGCFRCCFANRDIPITVAVKPVAAFVSIAACKSGDGHRPADRSGNSIRIWNLDTALVRIHNRDHISLFLHY